MRQTTDKYKLNLFCTCLTCENRNRDGLAYSCKEYPEQMGIPPKIWNTENAQCEHFEAKQSE